MDIRLSSALPPGIVGGILLVAAYYVPQQWLSGVALGVGAVTLSVSAATVWAWVATVRADLYRDRLDAEDRALLMAHAARGMTAQQIDYAVGARHIAIDVELAAGMGVERYLRGTDIPLWFARYFLRRSYNYTACPVRTWTDGTQERRWAQQLTAMLINGGYLLPYGGGNQAARWADGVTPDLILAALAADNDEIDPQPLPHPAETPPEGAE
jgi:hypothetical protein